MVKYTVLLHQGSKGWVPNYKPKDIVMARGIAVRDLLFRNKYNDYAIIAVNGKETYIVQIGKGGYKPGDALVHGYMPIVDYLDSRKSAPKEINIDGTFMRRN